MSRAPIAKKFVGTESCQKVDRFGDPGGPLTLCIRGAKFGFIGELHPTTGKGKAPGPLPVSTGDARTPEQAFKNARAFLRRVSTKLSGHNEDANAKRPPPVYHPRKGPPPGVDARGLKGRSRRRR